MVQSTETSRPLRQNKHYMLCSDCTVKFLIVTDVQLNVTDKDQFHPLASMNEASSLFFFDSGSTTV